ncbi:receptor-type tyrosine-protein phosphatase delta-like [Mercenaria mercenaria]|uniref:receptor-type tyrosine-protein phosphatase delta-like n=1 Tax=Mercenaria mercenaria TaxID=6596 RepID=UPI00234EAB3A|nr:receptor-type tyrosine-protein phosphatase delta-like [Mercenaria mercenaria]
MSDKSIWIEWEQPPQDDYSCEVQEYKIKYRKIQNQQFREAEAVMNQSVALPSSSFIVFNVPRAPDLITNFTLPDLEPSTEYEICVLASGIVGDGPCSNSIFVTTFCPAPGPARKVKGKGGTRKISLAWDPPIETQTFGPVLGYKISCRKRNSRDDFNQRETEQLDFEFSNLDDKTLYEIKVVAYNESGDSPEELLEVQTLPSAPGPARKVKGKGGTRKISLAWDPPIETQTFGPVLGYKISCRKRNSRDDFNQRETEQLDFEFSNLDDKTWYEIRVVAYNESGDSPEELLEVQTLPSDFRFISAFVRARILMKSQRL